MQSLLPSLILPAVSLYVSYYHCLPLSKAPPFDSPSSWYLPWILLKKIFNIYLAADVFEYQIILFLALILYHRPFAMYPVLPYNHENCRTTSEQSPTKKCYFPITPPVYYHKLKSMNIDQLRI